ncbi:MAG: hypothetical protein SO147_06120 [Clostridia bacterium]|nr:hypothetical protein [Clostridia bacterium]
MSDNLSELMKNLMEHTDQRKLRQSLPQLMQLLSNPQGQELVRKIKQADPDRLAALLGQIDTQAAARNLNRAETILEQAGKDPNYLKKLSKML